MLNKNKLYAVIFSAMLLLPLSLLAQRPTSTFEISTQPVSLPITPTEIVAIPEDGSSIVQPYSQPKVASAGAFYDSIDSVTNSYNPGGAAPSATATLTGITRLIADDLTSPVPLAGKTITGITFAVFNGKTQPVSARPRIRFYDDNNGSPGTYLNGYSFTAIAFPVGSSTYNATIAVALSPTFGNKIWVGMTFDTIGTTTGAKSDTLNSLGILISNPSVGTSSDSLFITTLPGSYLSNNPAGTKFIFTGNVPKGNMFIKLSITCAASVTTTTLPSATALTPYTQTVATSGTNGTNTFSISAGSLPASLTLNTMTGQISGTPTAAEAGDYTFTVQVRDRILCTATQPIH